MTKFQHLVITGTSGVGKTFLEEKLEETGFFSPLPKVVDRPRRPGEDSQKVIALSTEEFLKKKSGGEFFFTLDYVGHHYGWFKSDLRGKTHKTLAITLEALKPFLEQNSDFLPILLVVTPENFGLLEKRMHGRGETKEKIDQRLKLAQREYEKMVKYQHTVKENNGLIFQIVNDASISDYIIPQILAVFK